MLWAVRDLELFDPGEMRILSWMLVTSPIEETFPTTFEDVTDDSDKRGVTDANKNEYARFKCNKILVTDRLRELTALRDGFEETIRAISSTLPEAVRALTASDLQYAPRA